MESLSSLTIFEVHRVLGVSNGEIFQGPGSFSDPCPCEPFSSWFLEVKFLGPYHFLGSLGFLSFLGPRRLGMNSLVFLASLGPLKGLGVLDAFKALGVLDARKGLRVLGFFGVGRHAD